jgi:hypothetical protein
MHRVISISIITLLLVALVSSAALAPTQTNPIAYEFNIVTSDVIADYTLFKSLMQDTCTMDQYQVSVHADNPNLASAYLLEGFDPALAEAITDYYMRWIPELNKMIVLGTDSIPVITYTDKPYLNMRHISPDKVVLERIYTNYYEVGDQYLYLITAQKRGGRWIVLDMKFDTLTNTEIMN